jgi:hypothetical protein
MRKHLLWVPVAITTHSIPCPDRTQPSLLMLSPRVGIRDTPRLTSS